MNRQSIKGTTANKSRRDIIKKYTCPPFFIPAYTPNGCRKKRGYGIVALISTSKKHRKSKQVAREEKQQRKPKWLRIYLMLTRTTALVSSFCCFSSPCLAFQSHGWPCSKCLTPWSQAGWPAPSSPLRLRHEYQESRHHLHYPKPISAVRIKCVCTASFLGAIVLLVS